VTFESAQGAVTATRQENLDENNRVIGYTYFALNSESLHTYG
jgi:hypothetical protein